MSGIPHRPRLAEYVSARHHVTAKGETVVLLDARDDARYELELHEWDAVSCADGTRDFDGIALATASRGSLRRMSSLRELLAGLANAGLLVPGTASPQPVFDLPPATPDDRPVDVLEGFTLVCDGRGTCCRMYGSVAFSDEESERARVLARPDVPVHWLFTPLAGARPMGQHAVTLVSGACAFLDPANRCRIHSAAGAAAKPLVCRTFPRIFVDDGVSVRASVGLECACVAASVGRTDGSPIVTSSQTNARDLALGPRLLRIPLQVALRPDVRAPREDVAAWSTALLRELPPDAYDVFTRIAITMERDGLAPLRASSDVPDDHARDVIEHAISLVRGAAQSLARLTDRVHVSSNAGLAWMAAATPEPVDVAPDRDPDPVEALYLRAQIHGHQAISPDIATAARLRAARIVLARAMKRMRGDVADRGARWFVHPIVAVESITRALGIVAIARD